MKKRYLALIMALVVCALSLALAACGNKSDVEPADADTTATGGDTQSDAEWDYISEKGKLVIGITDFAPMNYYEDDGTLTGFDTEFAKAVGEKLGLSVEFKEIVWKSKEIELESKAIDCIWNGFTVDEERMQQFDFSSNYLENKQVIVINKANAGKYTSLDSFKGASVVAEEGSAGESVVLSGTEFKLNYTPVDSQAKALLEVKSGTADVAVIDYVMAKYLVNTDTDYADLTVLEGDDFSISSSEYYAIGFRKPSTVTVEKVNAAIAELKADGTLASLAEKYGIADAIAG